MNKLALMDKAMLDQGVANASSDVKQANFLNLKFKQNAHLAGRAKKREQMNELQGEIMTIELNWGEELKVFNVVTEDIDNKATYSVLRGK